MLRFVPMIEFEVFFRLRDGDIDDILRIVALSLLFMLSWWSHSDFLFSSSWERVSEAVTSEYLSSIPKEKYLV
jgi:hypothetical protein